MNRDPLSFPKPGRNESCPCGSKKKFKRCCLVRLREQEVAENERIKRTKEIHVKEYFDQLAIRMGKSGHGTVKSVMADEPHISWVAKQAPLSVK